jgi:hypothetical protein
MEILVVGVCAEIEKTWGLKEKGVYMHVEPLE